MSERKNEGVVNLGKNEEVREESVLTSVKDEIEDFKIKFAVNARKTPFERESKLSEWSGVAVNFFNEVKPDDNEKPSVLKLKFKNAVGVTKFLTGVERSSAKSGLQHSETRDAHFVNSPGGRNLLYYKKKSDEVVVPLTNHSWSELLDYLTVFFKNLG